MNEYKVLILDDLESVIKSFKRELNNLENICISVTDTQTEKDTFKELEKHKFDILFIDQRLKDGKLGSEIAKKIKEKYNDVYIVMQTAFGLDSAEEAIRSRVFSDFISKSNDDYSFSSELLLQIFTRYDVYREQQEKILQVERQLEKAEKEKEKLSFALAEFQKDFNVDISKYDDKNSKLKGNSDAMKQIRWFIDLYANVDLPILILGETGTGKELVAEEIHKKSNRKYNAYEIRNCAAIPETLIESELFGAKAGAATDIKKDLKGAFKLADNGTLFLDEFGDMSPNVQVKVLRAIETGTFRPLGADKDEKVNIRVICATSKDLTENVKENVFRKDLYYRVISLFPKMPLLSERREDIKDIYYHLYTIKRWTDSPFTNEAIQSLIEDNYEWEGNVRELIKFFEHTVAIFPDSKFDKDKTLKLLNLWKEHKPVSGLAADYYVDTSRKKNNKAKNQEAAGIEYPQYKITEMQEFLEKYINTYNNIEKTKNKKPTIQEIEKILEPDNQKGWLSQRFSTDQIDSNLVRSVINSTLELDRLKTIPPIKKFFT